jgi:hypothetical protein
MCKAFHSAWIVTVSMGLVSALGCDQGVPGSVVKPPAVDAHAVAAGSGEHAHEHTHDSWWCAEHGVPEEICGLCDSKVAAAMQKKGDWCKEHDRPDSQCFKCHPELEAKFAAQYEAKYGKQPPKPEG